ncbi:MAG TPA: NAD(P)(+) transhydrogenase (Re/Si-specific) subunit beta [Planctomycetota bacterium]
MNELGVLPNLAYLLATALFVLGLKRLGRVRTARRGNQFAALGMLVAVVTTLAAYADLGWGWIIAGALIGTLVGAWLARTVAMTSMPEMVALLNGLGGGASLLVALAVLWSSYYDVPDMRAALDLGAPTPAQAMNGAWTATVLLSVLIGGVTLTGSLVAVGKLSGRISGNAVLLPFRHLINLGLGAAAISLGLIAGWGATGSLAVFLVVVLAIIAFALGVLLVIPIGGADMPVVISLLNSYSGIAASMTGFVIGNPLLIAAGALVGASGLILTQLMCKAMNRSIGNVLVGGFGASDGGGGDQSDYVGVKSASPEEAAMLLEAAASVIFVPGYGMAVAQAQHVVKELMEKLEKNGTEVRFAIHPVAGRMPGHMNVLLAEADVPYEKLLELEKINGDFRNTDVVVIVGANDVVNPVAVDDPQSPIAGMPILNAYEAQTVLMIKRSLSPGYAGIKNPLFERDNCLMCFGDGKEFLAQIVQEFGT